MGKALLVVMKHVVEESDGDLMGDGVNIAARLEGVAQPGAICLSEDAFRQVKSRLDLAVSDLGETKLKNIAEPIRVYSLQCGNSIAAKATSLAGVAPALSLPEKPSVDEHMTRRSIISARPAAPGGPSIGEIFLLRVPRHVLKRQDRSPARGGAKSWDFHQCRGRGAP
jgi:hypothetical protein